MATTERLATGEYKFSNQAYGRRHRANRGAGAHALAGSHTFWDDAATHVAHRRLLWAGSASSVFHRLVSIYKRTSDDATYKYARDHSTPAAVAASAVAHRDPVGQHSQCVPQVLAH